MSILNQTELEAANLALLPSSGVGAISASNHRLMNTHMIESLQSYAGVILDGNVPGISITGTPALYNHFTTDANTPNDIFTSDQANGKIIVKEPCLVFISITYNGQWAANEDLVFMVYINGAANPFTPIELRAQGQGTSDPTLLSVGDQAFIVNSTMIAAGGGSADIEIFASSDTGTFTLEQLDITFAASYNPLTIRTVG